MTLRQCHVDRCVLLTHQVQNHQQTRYERSYTTFYKMFVHVEKLCAVWLILTWNEGKKMTFMRGWCGYWDTLSLELVLSVWDIPQTHCGTRLYLLVQVGQTWLILFCPGLRTRLDSSQVNEDSVSNCRFNPFRVCPVVPKPQYYLRVFSVVNHNSLCHFRHVNVTSATAPSVGWCFRLQPTAELNRFHI